MEDTTGEGKRGSSKDRWPGGDELFVEESHLTKEPSHMLEFHVTFAWLFFQSDLQESVNGGVTNNPVQSLQDVPLHLYEHILVIELTAHGS